MEAFMRFSLRCLRILSLFIAFLLPLGACERRSVEAPFRASEQTKPFIFKEKPTSTITLLSTQMNPVEEAGKMRNVILKDFPGKVNFRPNDNSQMFSQIDAMLKSNPIESIILGASHGDFVSLYERGALNPMNEEMAKLADRRFPATLTTLCKLNGKDSYYVPWMQASFVFVANKKALAYLPKDARLDALTYDQLYQWAGEIFKKTGMRALGFPAGKNGLIHRFFQGYLYPSFTASTLLKFKTAEAKRMWAYFKGLWEYIHPGSLVYSSMSEPLLSGDVWIAWDHTARLIKALRERPDDFVAFPAPIGPKGRGFMLIVAGLGIPKIALGSGDQTMLIDYLTEPTIQERMLSETGFFPVVSAEGRPGLPGYLAGLDAAVKAQTNAGEAIPTLAPIGLGDRGTDYSNAFMMAFSGIVLEDKDIQAVLNANASELQRIIDGANAKCWLPDVSDKRPCKIE
jgi:multiple sugar transport system substrate-binding protein